MKLKEKVAIVTGSSRGIGEAIARAFAREGAKVVVCAHQALSSAEAVAGEIQQQGGMAIGVKLEIRDRQSVRDMLDRVTKVWDGIDILVNNAGINVPKAFDEVTDDDWNTVISVNLTGTFVCVQETLPYIREGGRIINIASISGQIGGPKSVHYAVSKAGVIALTQGLARFCAQRRICVNAISPGYVETDMLRTSLTPELRKSMIEPILLGRLGLPEDVASAAVFLASDEASYMTGQTVNVNGGMYF